MHTQKDSLQTVKWPGAEPGEGGAVRSCVRWGPSCGTVRTGELSQGQSGVGTVLRGMASSKGQSWGLDGVTPSCRCGKD